MAYILSSHWKRFASFLVDSLILSIFITRPLSNLIQASIPKNITDLLSFDLKNIFIVASLISLINFLYWVLLEYKIQQTLGGLIFGIYMKSEKNKLTLSKVILRNITKISTILLIIDVINVFISKKRQRFTERITNTITLENG